MATRVVPAPLAQIPNALTVLRLAAIPVFVVLMLGTDGEGSYGLAALFAAAALTDQVDGYLARRWRVESEFGKFADPLADRLMIDAAVLLLCLDGRLPWLALVIVLGRDVVLIGGYRLVKDRGYEFSVSLPGKDRHMGALRGDHRRDRLRQGNRLAALALLGGRDARGRRGRPLRHGRDA
jgi:CDP-diacylglycerol--glycerol-3-phosphate 3-phosphatidyltransferase